MNTSTTQNIKNAEIGFDDDILFKIHQPSINIAIQQRNISYLENDISQLMQKSKANFNQSGKINQLEIALIEYFESIGIKSESILLNDIIKILRKFKRITEYNEFKLLLSVVNTDMCRRFHTDMNHLRLLCTYSGPGTLWIPDESVNRNAIQFFKDNDEIIKKIETIQQVNTGDICILKGALYPFPNTYAIVHRSPSVEESGSKRLLLRIDTNESLI
jgi:hypothetical protein